MKTMIKDAMRSIDSYAKAKDKNGRNIIQERLSLIYERGKLDGILEERRSTAKKVQK